MDREDALWLECQRDDAAEKGKQAERVLLHIDRILCNRLQGTVTNDDALARIEALVVAWTDPKEGSAA